MPKCKLQKKKSFIFQDEFLQNMQEFVRKAEVDQENYQ